MGSQNSIKSHSDQRKIDMKSSNTKTPAVSVIVPVYNVEPYIEKCARSLFEQTLENLEIIFVDDCSPDNSIDIVNRILEEYPERKNSTRFLKMAQNSGQASVRKRGMEEAKGTYVIHCDADDWVDPELYQTLCEVAKKEEADIVVCDEVMEYKDKTVSNPTVQLSPSGRAIMKDWYRSTIGLFCHNKLVRRSLYINNEIFPWEGLNMWEDNGLFARLFCYANKVAQIQGGPVYHYNRTNINAMTSGYGDMQVEQMIGIASNLTDFFQSQPDASDFQKTVYAFQYLAKLNLIADSFKRYQRYKKIFPASNSIITQLDKTAFSHRGHVRFNMVRYGFSSIFIVLYKFLKVLRQLSMS